jgi:hypothetical protein
MAQLKKLAQPLSTIQDDPPHYNGSWAREEVKKANVIWGYDTVRDRMTLFYGKDFLERIINEDGDEDTYPIQKVFEYDQRTDSLAWLVAAVQVLKGSDCYEAGIGGPCHPDLPQPDMSDTESDGMFWHYTHGDKAKSILADGLIRTTAVYIEEKERPVAWFSSEPYWEPTANKMRLPKAVIERGVVSSDDPRRTVGMMELFGQAGIYRFGVAEETAPLTWGDFKSQSGISNRMARGLEKAATDQGAYVDKWRASFEDIPRTAWARVDRFDGDKWVPMELAPV